MTDPQQRTPLQRKVQAERDQIDSFLAGAPAFWGILAILVLVIGGAIIGSFA